MKKFVAFILLGVSLVCEEAFVACSGDAVSSQEGTHDNAERLSSSSFKLDGVDVDSVRMNQLSSSYERYSSALKETSSSSENVVNLSSRGPETKEEYYAEYDDDSLYVVICGNNAFDVKGSNCYRKYSKCLAQKKGDGYNRCVSWTGKGCPADAYYSSGCVNSTCTKWETVYSYDSSFVLSNPYCEYSIRPNYTIGMACLQNSGFIKNEVDKELFVCDADSLRLPTSEELELNKICTSFNQTDFFEKEDFQYECKKNGWVKYLPVDSIVDSRDGSVYKTIKVGNQVWMYDNLTFDRDSSWCASESDCKSNGRLYTWAAAMNLPKECNDKFCGSTIFFDQGACPEGWIVPNAKQLDSLYTYAKKNDVFDQVNIPQMYGYIAQLWTRDYPGTSATHAYQMYNQENTTMEMRMIAEPKSKGVYVKCLQGILDVEKDPYDYEKIKDERDGREYRIITIGSQTWMAENLNYDAGSEQSWCFLFLEENCEKYGRLYTWDAVMGNLPKNENGYVLKEYIEQPHQGICPNGWHVPSDSEWIDLKKFVNDDGKSLKSNFGWKSNGNGSDLYHFRALPAGYTGNTEYYESYDKESHGIGSITFFHTTKQSAVNIVFVGSLTSVYATVWSSGVPKYVGASLRCIRNEN